MSEIVYLSGASITPPSGRPQPANLPTRQNGLPIHYRWMDAAYVGNWKHPKTGVPVPIDNDRIDMWASKVRMMRGRSVNLPVCKDHKETADNCIGEIYDARRNGNRLELLLGFKGDDSLAVAQRNYLSLGVDASFRDSRGNAYGEAIRHVAVTPTPVIHGQTGFLALSRNSGEEPKRPDPFANTIDAIPARVTVTFADSAINRGHPYELTFEMNLERRQAIRQILSSEQGDVKPPIGDTNLLRELFRLIASFGPAAPASAMHNGSVVNQMQAIGYSGPDVPRFPNTVLDKSIQRARELKQSGSLHSRNPYAATIARQTAMNNPLLATAFQMAGFYR